MFGKLTDNIGNVFNKLKGRGVLREEDIDGAMREIRIALLEADVSLPVAKDFIKKVKEKALGEDVIKSVSPAQMVIKIVQDELEEVLGSEASEINLNTSPPAVIMMVGLQGSGKTTSSGKLAKLLKDKNKKKVLLASLDIYRPAAQKQLKILGEQVGVDSLEIIEGQKPEEISKRALKEAKLGGYDVLIVDTAGRLNIDNELMTELENVKKIVNPVETLLVGDAMTGQEAVTIAKDFNDRISITGIILTRIDGDARGGAALSMKAVTGQPIKFIGVGEKTDEFEVFHPERIASRILDMGDIVSLVEKAQSQIDEKDAEKMVKKFKKGTFDLDDMYKQIKTIEKMGGMGSVMGMIPMLSKFKDKAKDANLEENVFKKQLAIIDSMTKKEKQFPKLLNASRKKRIAKGSGSSPQEINVLLKQFTQMQKMMKKMKGGGMKNMMKQMGGMGGMKDMLNQFPKG